MAFPLFVVVERIKYIAIQVSNKDHVLSYAKSVVQ